MNYSTCITHVKRLALGLAALALAATPSFAQTTYDLCASDGTVNIGGDIVTIWGYADITGGAACTTGLATLPGPVLTAADGETLTINLSNALSVPVSIFIPGMAKTAGDALNPVVGTDGGGRERLSSLDKTVTAGGPSVGFSWTASEGTYLYHSGNDIRTQVPMGLYGALVVSGGSYPAVAAEQVLVFSEIDPALNANPATFKGARVSNWNPRYFLINGVVYDAANPPIAININEDVLLRFVNAGLETFVPTLGGGLYMDLIAEDGNLYPHALTQYGVELQAGKTYDAVINAGAAGTYAIYDRALHLANGGMLAKIEASEGVGAPIVAADSYSVDEDTVLTADGIAGNPAGVLDNDTGAAAAVLVSGPASGVLSLAGDGTFTYTPNPNFFGSDGFSYAANDGAGGPNSLAATVTITVNAQPDAPVAVADAYDAEAGATLNVAAPGVLGNDSDPDGDVLQVRSGGPASAGTVVVMTDGSFNFNAAGLADGAIATFDYDICDGDPALPATLCSTPALVTINVIAAPPTVNEAPVAVDDTASMTQGTTLSNFDIVGNDTDADGSIDATSVLITTGGTTQRKGTVVNNGDGTITYTPPRASFRGTDTFEYTVNDNEGATSNVATVRINVTR